ncbi:MAG: MGMT family protein [Candidatus Cloacimonadota bacterium]|nr:MGMT family protein [Candidatus Cloacimonadota bacterium]
MKEFSKRIIKVIKKIPSGKVLTYGRVSNLAGSNNGARQVSRILHTCSTKHELPWHRVINSKGKISLGKNSGYYVQQELLLSEDVIFENDKIDLDKFMWKAEGTF